MKTVYLFSGLGVDHRAFQRLDLSAYHCIDIPWIPPLANEKIEAYAKRLSLQIEEPNPIFVGLSFGGMMAIEVAKHLQVDKIILLASVKKRAELPFYYRWAGKLHLHKLIPMKWLTRPHLWTAWLFGAKSRADKKLLTNIIKDTDLFFLKWALNVILNWQNDIIPTKIVHIHGTNDRILPLRFIKADVIINNGAHLMTVNKAKEVSKAIRYTIDNL